MSQHRFPELPSQDKIIADGSNKHIPTNLQRTYQFRSISKKNMVPQAICHPLCYSYSCYLLLHLHLPCLGDFLISSPKKIMTHRLQVDGSFVTHLGLPAKPTFANSSIIHELESVDLQTKNTISNGAWWRFYLGSWFFENLKLHGKRLYLLLQWLFYTLYWPKAHQWHVMYSCNSQVFWRGYLNHLAAEISWNNTVSWIHMKTMNAIQYLTSIN